MVQVPKTWTEVQTKIYFSKHLYIRFLSLTFFDWLKGGLKSATKNMNRKFNRKMPYQLKIGLLRFSGSLILTLILVIEKNNMAK